MEARELTLTNRIGKRMPATLLLPDGQPRGTAVIFHGIGGWKDQPLLARIAEALAADGYAVFRFNESNCIASPDSDFFHETTSQYARDVEDAFAYLKSQPWYVAPLVLVGHSLGGLIATWYAAEHPGEAARLVLTAPAVSWKAMWWAQLPFALVWIVRGHRMMLGMPGRKFALSPLWWKDFARFDGYAYAPRIMIPTLILSAERDHTVAKPFVHRGYTRKFPNAEHSTISWADHDFNGHEDEVIATIRQWLTSS